MGDSYFFSDYLMPAAVLTVRYIESHQTLVGWLGGFLSATLIPTVTWILKRRSFKSCVDLEFDYLRIVTVSTWLNLANSRLEINSNNLGLMKKLIARCKQSEELVTLSANIARMAKFTDDQLAEARKYHLQHGERVMKTIPKFRSPFLEESLQSVPLLPKKRRQVVIRALRLIDTVNGQIGELAKWNESTFHLDGANYVNAMANVESTLNALIVTCEHLARVLDSEQWHD